MELAAQTGDTVDEVRGEDISLSIVTPLLKQKKKKKNDLNKPIVWSAFDFFQILQT
jgi:hypothetical protein